MEVVLVFGYSDILEYPFWSCFLSKMSVVSYALYDADRGRELELALKILWRRSSVFCSTSTAILDPFFTIVAYGAINIGYPTWYSSPSSRVEETSLLLQFCVGGSFQIRRISVRRLSTSRPDFAARSVVSFASL